MQKSSAAFGSETVLLPDGRSVPVKDCWRERPAVIVFIRHFG